VQVGPYNDTASAQAAQQSLEKAGFKIIVKR
jgi:cell division protein FtsN